MSNYYSTRACLVMLLLWGTLINTNAQIVDAGNGHAIILNKKGEVFCVGRNDHGQLGQGTYIWANQKKQVKLPKCIQIARGYDHSLAIDQNNNLWVWGNNRKGQLGNSDLKDVLTPTLLKTDIKFSKCEGGYDHNVLLDTDGRVWSLGSNFYGELGRSSDTISTEILPVQISEGTQLSNISSIVSVGSHSLALDSSGVVYSWGANYYGELGHFNLQTQEFAQSVPSLNNIQKIAAGWGHSIVLDSSGAVYAFGAKPHTHSLKNKVHYYDHITQVEGLPVITDIACGSWHAMATDAEGNVWSWGRNQYGMLGSKDFHDRENPIKMEGIEGAETIGAGCFQSLALDSSGTIFSCGANHQGQMGVGETDNPYQPQFYEMGKEIPKEEVQLGTGLNLMFFLISGLILISMSASILMMWWVSKKN